MDTEEGPEPISLSDDSSNAPSPMSGPTPGIVIWAFVLSLLGGLCITAILGIVFGFIGRGKAKQAGSGVGLATAAIIIGFGWIAVSLVGFVALGSSSDSDSGSSSMEAASEIDEEEREAKEEEERKAKKEEEEREAKEEAERKAKEEEEAEAEFRRDEPLLYTKQWCDGKDADNPDPELGGWSSYISVDESGDTLRIEAPAGNSGDDVADLIANGKVSLAVTCTTSALGTPEPIVFAIQNTSGIMGLQEEEDGDLTYQWAYSQSTGLSMLITRN